MTARAPACVTTVALTWIEAVTEQWIRFGRAVDERIIDRRRRLLSFPPGAVFALVRWTGGEHGTVLSRLDIVRALRPDEPQQTLPCVAPGAEILLRADGWPKVERVLNLIDAIEAAGVDPVEVSPDHWRHVHNRLATGETPRRYTPFQHQAYRLRRRIGA